MSKSGFATAKARVQGTAADDAIEVAADDATAADDAIEVAADDATASDKAIEVAAAEPASSTTGKFGEITSSMLVLLLTCCRPSGVGVIYHRLSQHPRRRVGLIAISSQQASTRSCRIELRQRIGMIWPINLEKQHSVDRLHDPTAIDLFIILFD